MGVTLAHAALISPFVSCCRCGGGRGHCSHLENAVKTIEKATQEDGNGNYPAALELYREGLEHFMKAYDSKQSSFGSFLPPLSLSLSLSLTHTHTLSLSLSLSFHLPTPITKPKRTQTPKMLSKTIMDSMGGLFYTHSSMPA